MKIGDEVYVHGYVDEIRQDTVIIRNDGGYFGTAPSEVAEQETSCRNPRQVDRISRQDAVNEIHKYFVEEIDKTPTEIDESGDELYADMPTVNSLLACNKELSKRIKSLPSAKPKRGKWVDKGDFYICSECGERMTYAALGSKCSRAYAFMSDYCPHCGARMEEVSDEE